MIRKLILLLAATLQMPAGGWAQDAVGARIRVDASRKLGTLEPFWASQIVHPTESLLTDWGRDFLRLLAQAGAARQYVRIYNQPEAAIRIAADGKVSYDWAQFDRMADMILATGNKVKVVFFGMPYALAAHPEVELRRPNGARVCISPPKDYRQWEAMCVDFTRHVITKYGLDEVKQWTFRCWNEPNLTGFWYRADMSEYLRLYDHFANGVKGVSSAVKIGGPALASTRTYSDPKDFKFFLEHVAHGVNRATGEIGSPIDFISVHTYGGTAGAGGPGREFPDLAYMIEQQNRCADMRDAYPRLKGLPIHVEEWGESSGGTTGVEKVPTAEVRNSEYGAAFLASLVERHLRMLGENDRHFVSFTFCASGYEKPRQHDFMGYRTLDTKNGFHKPILNAYKLLNKLAPELVRVETGGPDPRVSAFATRDEQRVTVVVTNYQHDRIDGRGASCAVELSIVPPWAPGRPVTLRHWRIDGQHSNAYAVFKQLGSPTSPTSGEIAAIRQRMDLELLDPPRQMTGAELNQLAFEIPCNAVSLVEVVCLPAAGESDTKSTQSR